MKKIIYSFSEGGRRTIGALGGKGANLAEMTQQGFPIPSGFTISAQVYFRFVEEAGIQKKILKIVDIDVHNTKKLHQASRDIEKIVLAAPIPLDIKRAIDKAYEKLGKGKDFYVAARSSATAEDLPEASFAGQQATFLDVIGKRQLIQAVKKCWASLYTPRAIFYRINQGFEHGKVGIAVVVQEMVPSETAGVMFTADPTGDESK
ncbi:MAG TPA: phosphoenolpyruvate synthase, partial [Candidatus Peregrinibacteria bacterium]|nr:phosphoenolpyruvate synthase [Candidatus Peregrinibacteria bacterium]